MPRRRQYWDTLQIEADLRRVPFALSFGAPLFFLLTVTIDREATYRAARGALGVC
jgi:hypothetical protein